MTRLPSWSASKLDVLPPNSLLTAFENSRLRVAQPQLEPAWTLSSAGATSSSKCCLYLNSLCLPTHLLQLRTADFLMSK